MAAEDFMTDFHPQQFRHVIDIQVRWGDLDALGHVNNAVYLTFMENARVRYMSDLHLWDGETGKIGMIMARAVLDYKAPLLHEDALAYTRISRLGNKSMDFEQLIARKRDGEVVCSGLIVGVVYDYDKLQSVVIPDAWRTTIIANEPALT
jgi:acyl-CoA thioester hydrolase